MWCMLQTVSAKKNQCQVIPTTWYILKKMLRLYLASYLTFFGHTYCDIPWLHLAFFLVFYLLNAKWEQLRPPLSSQWRSGGADWDLSPAVEVRQCEIWRSRLPEEKKEKKNKEKEEKEASLIKSGDLHRAGFYARSMSIKKANCRCENVSCMVGRVGRTETKYLQRVRMCMYWFMSYRKVLA